MKQRVDMNAPTTKIDSMEKEVKKMKVEKELPIWLVACRLETNERDILNPERKCLNEEIAGIHSDLRMKFKCRQITHTTLRYHHQVVDTSLWLISSEKTRAEMEAAREQWNRNKGYGYCATVEIFPIVTNEDGCRALEWMAKKHERKSKNHCRSWREFHGA